MMLTYRVFEAFTTNKIAGCYSDPRKIEIQMNSLAYGAVNSTQCYIPLLKV